MVSKERILELQEIINRKFNEDLSYEQTERIANALIRYFMTLKEAYLACKKDEI